MQRSGSCMCGKNTFNATFERLEASACHCGMCLRWAGGPWIGVSVASLEWTKQDGLETIQSSAWAERGFCRHCGSGLYYRLTAEGKYHGITSVSLGCLDDTSGVTMMREYFIDKKPDAYTLAGERETITEAEVFAMFGGDA